MSDLPNGWARSTVAGLVGPDGMFADGDWVESKDQDPQGCIRLLQLADIGDGVFVDKSHRFINEEKFAKLRCTEVLERDVLIARMPDPLGRACIAPKLNQRCITVVDIAILRPGKSSVLPECLMHFINSPDIREFIEREATGSTRKRIARGKLNEMELPIPPLAEQKRIADKLEAVLGRVDACRARLDRVPALLKRFRQSVLAAATSGGLTAEWRMTNGVNDEWETVPLKDTIDGIEQGWSPKCENEPSTNSADWAVIKTTAIQEMAFLEYENKRLPKHLKPRPNLEIQPGDILITRAGPRVRAAVTCMVDSVRPRLIVCDKVYRFRAKNGKTTPNYLNVFLNSPLIVQELDQMKTGISDSGVNLTQSKFRALQVPLPTLPEQQEIVRRVEDLFAFADRIEARLATARKTVERLTPATLAKAFRGELVPQDPSDEPASSLLTHLRNQPAAKPAKAKRIKRAIRQKL